MTNARASARFSFARQTINQTSSGKSLPICKGHNIQVLWIWTFLESEKLGKYSQLDIVTVTLLTSFDLNYCPRPPDRDADDETMVPSTRTVDLSLRAKAKVLHAIRSLA